MLFGRAVEIDDHDSAARFQAAAQAIKQQIGLLDLVIHVDHERHVQTGGGQAGIGLAALHEAHICEVGGAGALSHPFEHARRQILGKDPALRPHHWCHAHHIIAAASADIGHRHAGLYAGDADHVGGFPRLVARSFLTPG